MQKKKWSEAIYDDNEDEEAETAKYLVVIQATIPGFKAARKVDSDTVFVSISARW